MSSIKYIISCLQLSTECNFNLHYFTYSVTEECLYKSSCLINSSVQIFLRMNWKFLEILPLPYCLHKKTVNSNFNLCHFMSSIKYRMLISSYVISCLQLIKNVFTNLSCNFIKKRLQHRYFLVNIRKFIRTPILKNICKRLHVWKVFCDNIFQIRT